LTYHSLTLWVPGTPVPQGSMRSPAAGVVLHNSPEVLSWRQAIGYACNEKWHEAPIDLPVRLRLWFYFKRPQRPQHPAFASTAADVDKLVRAVGDALQEARVLTNDARIVAVEAEKRWVATTGTRTEPGMALHLETVAEWAL
jgi:crossover junction endodeoxyribonuclease RusA